MLVFFGTAPDTQMRSGAFDLDETLIEQIGRGEKAAFHNLYQQTKGAVYGYALSLLRNQQDAEDAMQETYLKIRAAAHLYRAQGKPMAWIMTITRNICMMKFRQSKKDSGLSIEDLGQGTVLSSIESREDRIMLETALSALSREECQIIMLHAVSGLKHREISEMLQMPLSTVLSKYNRGIGKLRRKLEEAI